MQGKPKTQIAPKHPEKIPSPLAVAALKQQNPAKEEGKIKKQCFTKALYGNIRYASRSMNRKPRKKLSLVGKGLVVLIEAIRLKDQGALNTLRNHRMASMKRRTKTGAKREARDNKRNPFDRLYESKR